MMNNIDKLMSTGAKSAFNKNSVIGEQVSGTILSAMERQVTNYTSKQPEFWDNGDPKMQIVVSVQTDLREDADDDGARSIYIKVWGRDKVALLNAIRAAGYTKASEALAPGNRFTAAFVGTEPSTRGNDAKLYSYQIERGAHLSSLDAGAFGGPAPMPVVPAPQQAPNPWATQPQQPPMPAAQPAPYSIPQPAQAPAAQAAQTPGEHPAVTLIRQGADDATIQTQTGTTPDVIAIMRAQLAQ